VVTGSAAERDLADGVRRAAGLPASALLAGRTDLAELAALVAGARLVVCGDTGTAHLASAFRTPSVVLFGPIPPAFWGPPTDGPHRVLWHGTGTETGDPHAAEPDPRLLRISVEEVLAFCAEAA
jgi:ADP-heptose:LPS heptosyltransferase